MIGKLMRLLKRPSLDLESWTDPEIPMKSDLVDRMEGCILLGAAGDAMGYVVEFKQVDEIVRLFDGPISFSRPDRWRCRVHGYMVSDDTQMTMFGMESIARAVEGNSDDFVSSMIDETRVSYLQWYGTQGSMAVSGAGTGLLSYREMFAARAPGNTCIEALRLGAHGCVQFPINESKGCGGVMRAAPFAFVPGVGEETLWMLATASAALTHGHVFGWSSAGALALIIRRIILGASIRDAVVSSVTYMRQDHVCPPMADVLERCLAFDGRKEIRPEEIEALGGGWVGEECLSIGVVAAMMDADVATRMDVSANHGGDSDSTASIAGQIMGAFYGRKKLEEMTPMKDIFRDLDVARPLAYVMDRFGKALDQRS